ncbi:hypothetical protein GQX73_g7131 [Xylaria multiplex]|uniref:DNA-binding protein RAP1 n=1 Tax=Xylaria multiplex TaxID=323545 RepID=A0A7C8IL82_9PEZI|nr:hypothetical protein GQX73_g7131 [Xylaria multiplex]
MSAPGITYSGVLARKAANDSVDMDKYVFQGLKFWVSVRVPQRKTCLGTIEGNGGTVVTKESHADILICDQAREPIAGSYSYRLIADAVRDGSLDMKEDYMCSLPANRPSAFKSKLTKDKFTEEDDRVLTRFVTEQERLGKSVKGNDIYKEFAEKFPQRTYTSWRERALNHVAKQNRDQITQWESEVDFHLSNDEGDRIDNAEKPQSHPTKSNAGADLADPDQGSENTAMGVVGGSFPERTINNSTDENDKKQEYQDMASSPMHEARAARSPAGLLVKDGAPNYSPPSPIFNRPRCPGDTSVGVTERRIPSVRGKAVALWDLWQSVRSKKVETVELDWQQVAEDLGFDWVAMESIPEDLRRCYEEHLAPFAEAMMSFNDSSDEDDLTEANPDTETERLLPSSPPILRSSKRRFFITSPAHIPQSSPKRRRIDRNHEIPSTPESVNRRSNLRPPGNPDKTPTNSRLRHSSIPKPSFGTRVQSSVEKGDFEMRQEVANPPPPSQGLNRRLEPETQDFNFGPETQLYAHGNAPSHSENDSQKETTPSQQLRLESDAASPNLPNNTPVLAVSCQEIVQTTPMPRRVIQADSRADESDGGDPQPNPTRVRSTHTPLSARKTQLKRRTLPSSFISKSPTDSTIVQSGRTSSILPETELHQKPSPPKETPDDIIDHFVSLGYTRDIVLRSLKATSWIIGNAGQVMEMLKQGDPLPPRTTGVWTQRDDDSLALVFSNEAPSDAREEKRRAKEARRLQAKHGAEQIALRKRYLLDELPE